MFEIVDEKRDGAVIKVIGVGGCGGNAVEHMINKGVAGVEFIAANTDAQVLDRNPAPKRIPLGAELTQGLGAGAKPEVGRDAAMESKMALQESIRGADMLFITAGMGGGTGTGAAPVIARAAKEQGILTVGVVTKPFHFEGARRQQTAERGIEELARFVDTLIVIPNQNLFRVANEKTTFAAAFAMADQVLYSGVASITELMTKEGLINLDFADVRAIMSEMGKAMMGTGEASGEKRAIEAAEAAISNPLLDDVSMRGARGLLISISGGPDLTLYEVDEAANRIRDEVDPEANIILGATFDDSLEGTMRVSVVATGLNMEATAGHADEDEAETADEPARQVFGFTGKQPEPVRVMRPAPMAARAPAPAPEPVHVQHHETQRPAAQMPAPPVQMPPRMPAIEEFPAIAQRQIAAQQGRIETIAEQAAKKKKGLFERLANVGANVGLGRKEESSAPRMAAPAARAEPSIQVRATRVVAPAPQPEPQAAPAPEASYEDDQLAIPAFLRRQAHG